MEGFYLKRREIGRLEADFLLIPNNNYAIFIFVNLIVINFLRGKKTQKMIGKWMEK